MTPEAIAELRKVAYDKAQLMGVKITQRSAGEGKKKDIYHWGKNRLAPHEERVADGIIFRLDDAFRKDAQGAYPCISIKVGLDGKIREVTNTL